MRIPGFVLKKFLKIFLHEGFIEFNFQMGTMGGAQPLGMGLQQMILGVNNEPLFDIDLFPYDFHLVLNNVIYPNQEVYQLLNNTSQFGTNFSILVPNRANIGTGKYIFYLQTRGTQIKINVKLEVFRAPYPIQIPTAQTRLGTEIVYETPKNITFDFDTQRICPKCGSGIKIEHNFCKYCGQDLGDVAPIGKADTISKNLAITALTDPSPEVRKEAIDTLGGFKDTRALGVLTYILINDPDENVRKEAADELGDIHHPLSMEALSGALKDPSPLVRKEALEGLKKIKEKFKPKDSKD